MDTVLSIKADHSEQIYDYTLEQWQSLLDLIPTIEQTSVFGIKSGNETDEDQTITFPASHAFQDRSRVP
ncbi:MAG: hypothetical protein U5K71_14785 [Gracilimonas sp.]|nr:hypothetical protein [Gracilimonas sp.]